MKRAEMLRSRRNPRVDHRRVNVLILLAIFFLVAAILSKISILELGLFLVVVTLGSVIWFVVDLRRHKRELGAAAFQDWMDRCHAIARNYDVDLNDVESGASCELIWRNRWRGGLSPDQAVHQEIDARELGNFSQ